MSTQPDSTPEDENPGRLVKGRQVGYLDVDVAVDRSAGFETIACLVMEADRAAARNVALKRHMTETEVRTLIGELRDALD